VLLLTRGLDRSRGLAESLPPSTHKLLAELGVLQDVEQAGFYRSTGNTVHWASNAPRVESFGGQLGYQVYRPDLDRVLCDSAARAGVEIRDHARVADVRFDSDGVHVACDGGGTVDGRLVIDASGRTGVIGRQYRRSQPGFRTCALVGVWQRDRWDLPDPTHTVVETFERGWAWSVPISPTVRHVGVMVGRAGSYRDEVKNTLTIRRLVEGAALQDTFACDASLYDAARYAGSRFLLIGDAGSFIDPLSSCGVKKALASAWVGAIAANTALRDPARRGAVVDFVNRWERGVYADHLPRSRDFSAKAVRAHPHPFWEARAAVEFDTGDDSGEIHAAFERIRSASSIEFALAENVRVEPQPVIRGREIVLEDAFMLAEHRRSRWGEAGLRYADNVDLLRLAKVACRYPRVPDVYEAYCRATDAAPLPNVISGLSLLVAKGILHART